METNNHVVTLKGTVKGRGGRTKGGEHREAHGRRASSRESKDDCFGWAAELILMAAEPSSASQIGSTQRSSEVTIVVPGAA